MFFRQCGKEEGSTGDHVHLGGARIAGRASVPRALSVWGPAEAAAQAHPEQGPDCPRPAPQVRAVSLDHGETLQEQISVLLLLPF